jgi:hypothetical protein
MSFTYDETRDSEQLNVLKPAIDDFIGRFQNPPATTSTCPRRTMFFFPGGMATQLSRARAKFVDGATALQTFQYDPVWLVGSTFLGGARDLKMYRDSAGTFRDKGSRIIVSDGIVSFFGSTPHDALIDWCADNHVDLFVVPWDWRRRLDETAEFFARKFLPFFQARVIAAGGPDPLASFVLVGHSFGGMVVNLILRDNDPMVANLTHAITVATPFYGYPGQMHRWFEGEKYLNGPLDVFKQDMMETIASLPGLYILHFLDEVTYNNSTNQAALTAGDPDFPLLSYPSMDATTPNRRADPYKPQTNGALVRYPVLTGFDGTELDYARLQFQLLASPMDPSQLEKFYNIRGVRTEADEETPISDTIGSVTWDWIATTFDSTDPSPIVDGASVPGDDTQPAWTARLATNDPSRCITVRGSDVQHMCMMNHALVMEAIETILCPKGAAVSSSSTPAPSPVSDEDVVEFLRWMSANAEIVRQWTRLDDPKLRDSVPRKFRGIFDAIARRIMRDIMKRPGPKERTEPAAPPRTARAPKPPAGRGRRKSPRKRR